jgi:hypothetical protein
VQKAVTSIRSWHWGKLAILWAWGGTLVALLLSDFLTGSIFESPIVSTLTFLGSLTALVLLSVVTWIWLGGKEVRPDLRPVS